MLFIFTSNILLITVLLSITITHLSVLKEAAVNRIKNNAVFFLSFFHLIKTVIITHFLVRPFEAKINKINL